MTTPAPVLGSVDERAVIEELARRALASTAPEELPLFDDFAGQYYADPRGVLAPGKDESVGFGIELALLTPYLIELATAAVRALGSMFGDAVKAEGTPYVRSLIRKLFRLPDPAAAPAKAAPLSQAQARFVRDVALQRAKDIGLAPDKAGLLADAITGGLLVAH
jgi:hypothetical protein